MPRRIVLIEVTCDICGGPDTQGFDAIGEQTTEARLRELGGGIITCRYCSRTTSVETAVCSDCGVLFQAVLPVVTDRMTTAVRETLTERGRFSCPICREERRCRGCGRAGRPVDGYGQLLGETVPMVQIYCTICRP